MQQADRAKGRRKPTSSLTAYDLTLLAHEAKEKDTKEQNEEAVRLATRAIEADRGFARAWVTRSESYAMLGMLTGDFAPILEQMLANARQGLSEAGLAKAAMART